MIKIDITQENIFNALIGIIISVIFISLYHLVPSDAPIFFSWVFCGVLILSIFRLLYVLKNPKSLIIFDNEQKIIIIQNYDMQTSTNNYHCKNERIPFEQVKQVKRIITHHKGYKLMFIFKNNNVLTFFTNKKTIENLGKIFEIKYADFSTITDLISTSTHK